MIGWRTHLALVLVFPCAPAAVAQTSPVPRYGTAAGPEMSAAPLGSSRVPLQSPASGGDLSDFRTMMSYGESTIALPAKANDFRQIKTRGTGGAKTQLRGSGAINSAGGVLSVGKAAGSTANSLRDPRGENLPDVVEDVGGVAGLAGPGVAGATAIASDCARAGFCYNKGNIGCAVENGVRCGTSAVQCGAAATFCAPGGAGASAKCCDAAVSLQRTLMDVGRAAGDAALGPAIDAYFDHTHERDMQTAADAQRAKIEQRAQANAAKIQALQQRASVAPDPSYGSSADPGPNGTWTC